MKTLFLKSKLFGRWIKRYVFGLGNLYPPPLASRHIFKVILLICIGSWFFYSCEQTTQPPPSATKTTTKVTDPKKQEEKCLINTGVVCSSIKSCRKICDDIFSSNKLEKKCQELPQSTVEKIEDLLKTVEDGKAEDLENINRNILECLLDIDNKEFADAVKKQTRTEAQKFLLQILDDEALAKIFEDEDNDYIILERLLEEATEKSKLSSRLAKKIKDDDNESRSILHLFGEGAESAWDWLDDYVSDECDGSTDSDCPGEDSIGAYCNVLKDDNDLEEFLDSAGNFEDQYKGEVESDGYEYEVDDENTGKKGDFRVWCLTQEGKPEPNACPEDGTEPSERSAKITITFHGSNQHFKIKDGYCNNANPQQPQGPTGDSVPETQNIILLLTDFSDGEIFLNNDKVGYNSNDDNKTYYLYVDDKRYVLASEDANTYRESSSDDCSTTGNRNVVLWRDFFTGDPPSLVSDTPYDIYIAVEEEEYGAKFCSYIKP